MASKTDIGIVRELAARYADLAALEVQRERIQRYRDTNGLRRPRPVVLIDEIPWGEMGPREELDLRCEDRLCRRMEWHFRSWLYRWNRLQGDLVLPDHYAVTKHVDSTGYGFTVQERTIPSTTGSDIKAHEYVDQLADDDAIGRFRPPVLTYDREGTEREASAAQDILGGTLPVRITGLQFGASPWDEIATLRGVGRLLGDLYDRQPFLRRVMETLTAFSLSRLRQMEELNLLEPHPLYLHCTPACTDELPPAGYRPDRVTARDVWGRYAAQVFAVVSPAMHEELDIAYARRIMGSCGLLYYGCCEPLDRKIGILRSLGNLRKVSITPWADADRAADAIGRDFVLSYKPNPAFVAVDTFDPEPVGAEISRVLAACARNGTTCEFILKDISSVRNRPANLFQWERTVMDLIAERW